MSSSYNQDNTDPRLRGPGAGAEYGNTIGNSSGTGTSETYGLGSETHHGHGTGASIDTPLGPGPDPATGQQYGQGTTTGGVMDPNVHTTAETGPNTGEGIHAQQYREAEYGQGTTTTGAGVATGTGHHISHHHGHREHGHAPGEGLKTGCTTCHGQTTETTSTGAKEGSSNANLRPSETVVEKEKTVHHSPGTTGAGVGTYPTHGMTGTQDTIGKTSTGTPETPVGQQHIDEHGAKHHGKPTMIDKIIGGTEKGIGKMTANPTMVQKGVERAAGEFEPAKNN